MENFLFRRWYILVQLHSGEPSSFRMPDDPKGRVTSDLPPAAKHLFLSRTCSLGSSAPFKTLPNTNFNVIPWELLVSRRTCAAEDWQNSFLSHRRRIAWVKPDEFRLQRYLCLGLVRHNLPLSNSLFFMTQQPHPPPPSGPGTPHSRGF